MVSKYLLRVRVHHVRVPIAQRSVHSLHGLARAAALSITKSAVAQIRFEDWFQYQFGRGLCHSVPDRRNAERPLAASWLRNHHPSHRTGLVRPLPQFLPQTREPLLAPCRFDVRELHPVHPRRAAVAAGKPIRVVQYVLPVHFVVEQVEAERWLCLRLHVKPRPQVPDLFRGCQTHVNPLILCPPPRHPEVRPRSSTVVAGFFGTMGLSDSRTDRRLSRRRQSRPATQSGSPTLHSRPSPRAVLTTPASQRAARLGCSAPHGGLTPLFRRIGARIFTFEACSRFTRVTARGFAHPPEVGFTQGFTCVPGSLPGCSENSPVETFTHVSTAPPSWRTE